MNEDRCDVVIVGSGSGGGAMAWKLARMGKRILLIERGDYLKRERENWNTEEVFAKARYQAKETWISSSGETFRPGLHYFVGGNSKVYGAVLFRLRLEDFGPVRHPGGIAPEWPVKYDEFEPYYQAAEDLFEVRGTHGEDPTEPPRKPYPHLAIRHEPRIQKLPDDRAREGLHPFHLPMGALLDQDATGVTTPQSPLLRCDPLDGYPSLTNGKSDAAAIHPHLRERKLYLGKGTPIGGTAHQAGTLRFGQDPARDVLDLDCRAHGIDNLYVTDASFFPSIGAVNPTLTIIANALRVADRIVARLGQAVAA